MKVEKPNPFGLVVPRCRRCGLVLAECDGHRGTPTGERLRLRAWELVDAR